MADAKAQAEAEPNPLIWDGIQWVDRATGKVVQKTREPYINPMPKYRGTGKQPPSTPVAPTPPTRVEASGLQAKFEALEAKHNALQLAFDALQEEVAKLAKGASKPA